MEKRKEINEKFVQWILDKVQTKYAEDISLVLIYGSYINGTANSKSDVDCYYIPKTERGYGLSLDVIIEGVGYDIFPITWDRVERIADLQESLSPLVGDVMVLYSGSTNDTKRLKDMQERLKSNLQNDAYVKTIAAGRCEEAGRICAVLRQKNEKEVQVWKAAGMAIMKLAEAVAVYHHDYFHFGLKRQLEELQSLPDVPPDIINGYRNVVWAKGAEEASQCAVKMFEDVCGYLNAAVSLQERPREERAVSDKIDAAWLAELYEEICSTFNKVYVCCENGNEILAFLSAVCLQGELDAAGEGGCPAYDLLSGFDCRKLCRLSEKTRSIEKEFVHLITENGGQIKRFDSFEAFAAAKL